MMKRKCSLYYLLVLLPTILSSQTYITNVTVLDVEKFEHLPNQTVTIDHDRISGVGPSTLVNIPAGATMIDGTGKYLLPGLVDAHVHFSQSGGLYTRPDALDLRTARPYQEEIAWGHAHFGETLRRYLQNGITTVIDVGTTPNYLSHRAEFKGSPNAPSIYMSGPLITTYEPQVFAGLGDDSPFQLVTSIEDGRNLVRKQLDLRPDYIKIWYIVGVDTNDIEASARRYLPIITAIIDEAHKHKMKVAVHATQQITARLAVENGCDYLVHSVDDEVLSDECIALLKKQKTILSPTLIVHDGYVNTFGQRIDINQQEIRMSDPYQLGSLLDTRHLPDTILIRRYKAYANQPETLAEAKHTNVTMMTNLKKLSDAGVILATGTDAGNIGTLHASSYLREIKTMQLAGMTTWQVLQSSTINGAKVLGKEREFGTVSVGKLADMILLDADPVEDLDFLTMIHRVINKGVVIDPDTLISETPESVVQRQLNAYNFRNIEAFMETYADDVTIYDYPDKLLYQGKEEMRRDYALLFTNYPNLHCEITERTVNGNIVIDKESVDFGSRRLKATAMYHIENDKIQKVYFVQEKKE